MGTTGLKTGDVRKADPEQVGAAGDEEKTALRDFCGMDMDVRVGVAKHTAAIFIPEATDFSQSESTSSGAST